MGCGRVGWLEEVGSGTEVSLLSVSGVTIVSRAVEKQDVAVVDCPVSSELLVAVAAAVAMSNVSDVDNKVLLKMTVLSTWLKEELAAVGIGYSGSVEAKTVSPVTSGESAYVAVSVSIVMMSVSVLGPVMVITLEVCVLLPCKVGTEGISDSSVVVTVPKTIPRGSVSLSRTGPDNGVEELT